MTSACKQNYTTDSADSFHFIINHEYTKKKEVESMLQFYCHNKEIT